METSEFMYKDKCACLKRHDWTITLEISFINTKTLYWRYSQITQESMEEFELWRVLTPVEIAAVKQGIKLQSKTPEPMVSLI
jgi:hypothetical protein